MFFDKLKPWLPWIFRAVTLLVVILLVLAWNSARSARNELASYIEREKLVKADLIVEAQAAKADLKALEQKLLMENAALENEVQRLKDTLGKKPTVIEVVKWQTKEVPVEGPPVAIPCPDGTTVDCLLPPGATGHVEADEITYETKNNNHVIVGQAACWRDTPLPKAKLFSSIFSASKTVAVMQKEPTNSLPGWGGGIRGQVDNIGWAVGPVLAFPPLPFLFNTQIEFNIDLTFGTPWMPKPELPVMTVQGGAAAVLRGR
jgi:cell division protein FtsB